MKKLFILIFSCSLLFSCKKIDYVEKERYFSNCVKNIFDEKRKFSKNINDEEKEEILKLCRYQTNKTKF